MDNHEDIAQLLRWYADAGVDMAVDETAPDRLAAPLAPPPEPAPAAAPAVARTGMHVLSPEQAAQDAAGIAASAMNLEALREQLAAFNGCALKDTATQLVFSDGNPKARLMLVGEAPGREEDLAGKPFIGRAGKLLDRMLAAIGLDREQVYIANVVPWRPPGNRTPTPQETAICKPFILRQIALVNPDLLVCLGAPSAQTLLNQREGILRLRGNWFDFNAGPRAIRAMATLHPAYLLRQPAQKKLAWRDFRAVRAALDEKAE